MIHRLPLSELIRPHVNSILSLMLILIQEENEENVLICLRIIIDLHKQYRPPYYPQVRFKTCVFKFDNLNNFFLD
jgi:transformation/transcription domain-associated protein